MILFWLVHGVALAGVVLGGWSWSGFALAIGVYCVRMVVVTASGEGWHNNHHHYPSAANQGFFWWEIDMTYLILRSWQAMGLIWDLRQPPAYVLAGPLAAKIKPVTLGHIA